MARAASVDMLDRVVCAVYDGAKDGQFKARHKMAEWLGSNILDLYAVLEAMGHKIIHDPAAEKVKAEETPAAEAPAEAVETPAEAAPAAEKAKPELATFRLKRGRANQASAPRPSVPKKANGKKNPSQSLIKRRTAKKTTKNFPRKKTAADRSAMIVTTVKIVFIPAIPTNSKIHRSRYCSS